MGGGAPDSVVVTTSATDQAITREIATAQSIIIQTAFSPAGTTASPPEYIQSPEAFPPEVDCPAITFVAPQPQITRTAVAIFTRLIDLQRFMDATPKPATVVFNNNVPAGGALNALIAEAEATPNKFPITGVTLAVLTPPPDAGAAVRIDAVVNVLAAGGRLAANPRKTAEALSQRDRNILMGILTQVGVTLDGVDEILFLER
jgi:hypothetical protein